MCSSRMDASRPPAVLSNFNFPQVVCAPEFHPHLMTLSWSGLSSYCRRGFFSYSVQICRGGDKEGGGGGCAPSCTWPMCKKKKNLSARWLMVAAVCSVVINVFIRRAVGIHFPNPFSLLFCDISAGCGTVLAGHKWLLSSSVEKWLL